jgi:ketosteroid isomerase-like protein
LTLKRCPTCKKTFTDQNLTFCVDDGTPLVTTEAADETSADEATQVRSSARRDGVGSGSSSPAGEGSAPAHQPPGSYTPPGYAGQSQRRTWPWVLGFLAVVCLVIAGLAFAAVKLIPSALRASSNSNTAKQNSNLDRLGNSNANPNQGNANSNSTNRNENSNNNSDGEDTTPPPTDQEKVLADLKNLEDEWTVANINADKKQLNRILADDYVGILEGRSQGKAEYLKTIERDTVIQHWEFEDLKVSLKGDRASLTGILRLDVKNARGQEQQEAFRFTDKFVWRDGRWQATYSEVAPLPVKPGTTTKLSVPDESFEFRVPSLELA